MNILVRMIFGAHLYGTATADSDLDYKGVFLPSKREFLLGRIPKSLNYSTADSTCKNTHGDTDIEFYSIHHFMKLALEGHTVALDMLHAPKEMLQQSSPVWDRIVASRHRFYTKNIQSFVDYARRQASKYGIKGSRLNAVSQVLTILEHGDPSQRLRDIWDKLPKTEHCFDLSLDVNGKRQYQVCGKTFQESASIGYVVPILLKFREEYGRRAQLAALNENIDWKAVSHALRAAYQVREILTAGTITFPLRNADFLKKVKQGVLDYTRDVAPVLDDLMDEVEGLSRISDLPAKVDADFWDSFLCDVIEDEIFRCGKASS